MNSVYLKLQWSNGRGTGSLWLALLPLQVEKAKILTPVGTEVPSWWPLTKTHCVSLASLLVIFYLAGPAEISAMTFPEMTKRILEKQWLLRKT